MYLHRTELMRLLCFIATQTVFQKSESMRVLLIESNRDRS